MSHFSGGLLQEAGPSHQRCSRQAPVGAKIHRNGGPLHDKLPRSGRLLFSRGHLVNDPLKETASSALHAGSSLSRNKGAPVYVTQRVGVE